MKEIEDQHGPEQPRPRKLILPKKGSGGSLHPLWFSESQNEFSKGKANPGSATRRKQE